MVDDFEPAQDASVETEGYAQKQVSERVYSGSGVSGVSEQVRQAEYAHYVCSHSKTSMNENHYMYKI